MTSPSLPKTITAWTYSRPGPYRQTLSLTTSHPHPTFPPTNSPPNEEEHLLIKVAYSALNPGDAVLLRCMPWFFRSTETAVPCFDFTGTVLSVHHSQSRFAPGDKVVAFTPLSFLIKTGSGGLQEVISVPAKCCVLLPPTQSLRSAAGLFLTALTADLQVKEANVKEGDRVLVVGASGGCGSMAVQLVRNVVGTEGHLVGICSGRNEEMVKSLGCDEVIDYTQYTDLPDELAKRYGGSNNFDAIIDTYGDQTLYINSRHYLKPSGIYDAVSIHYDSYTRWDLLKSVWTIITNTIWPKTTWLGGTGRTFSIASMNDPSLEDMEKLNALFAEGKLRVVHDSIWAFEDVHQALDQLCSGHAAGKVVIKVDPEEK